MSLFSIIKLNTSTIVKNGYCINTDFRTAQERGEIITLGDNQLLKFIRLIKEVPDNREAVEKLYEERNNVKKMEGSRANSNKITRIQNQINEMLFVPDLVSIKADSKQEYKSICKLGFIVNIEINGKIYETKYKRLCAGAGQLRRNSALFVNEKIYDKVEYHMMCGLTPNKIGKINLAKFSAYYALYTSATNQVRKPRICVVKDFEYDLKEQSVSWIFDRDDGSKDIEDRVIDFQMNAFDGSGIISVDMAAKWAEDLSLDYLPSSFIIRSAWIKGLVSVFDFHKFAKEIAGKRVIVDAWGKERDVKDVDVILTTSQFKMWKKYNSWDEYIHYHKDTKQVFGVARVNKKDNNFFTPLNYQYIQSNDFTDDRIKGLADFSINWINKIMTGDKLYTMLFLMGVQGEDVESQEIENRLNSTIAKILMYDDSILKDDYVRKKINQMIEKKVRQIKIGKLLVEGSYDFAIPDLYALAEHAFGMEVKGLLPEKCSWNKRWVDKDTQKVAMMRSPLVAPAENQIRLIHSDDKCKEWFQYIQSGMIMSIWDLGMIAASDKMLSALLAIIDEKRGEPVNTGCAINL